MTASGKGKSQQDINIKGVPRDILDWVRHYARLDGRSMSKQIIQILREYVLSRNRQDERPAGDGD